MSKYYLVNSYKEVIRLEEFEGMFRNNDTRCAVTGYSLVNITTNQTFEPYLVNQSTGVNESARYLYVDDERNEVVTKPFMVGQSFNVTVYLHASSASGNYG